MDDDIVTRLQDTAYETDICWEAAGEIERLRAAGDRLVVAMSRHDLNDCHQCQDIIQGWKAVRGE